MSYCYETERQDLFTDEGQRTFLKIRDEVHRLLDLAGAVRMEKATAKATGSSWFHLACVDRLVELGEIVELTEAGKVWGQDRVFTRVRQQG